MHIRHAQACVVPYTRPLSQLRFPHRRLDMNGPADTIATLFSDRFALPVTTQKAVMVVTRLRLMLEQYVCALLLPHLLVGLYMIIEPSAIVICSGIRR